MALTSLRFSAAPNLFTFRLTLFTPLQPDVLIPLEAVVVVLVVVVVVVVVVVLDVLVPLEAVVSGKDVVVVLGQVPDRIVRQQLRSRRITHLGCMAQLLHKRLHMRQNPGNVFLHKL